MSDLRFAAAPSPEERRRLLRDALAAVVPGWQPLAQDVLGADARIDWVGRDGEGRCTIAMVGRAGEDLALIAQGLAQRDWVAARVADWAQLAPQAGLRPGADVVTVLLAPSFQPGALAAARAARGLRLVVLRFLENGAGVVPLIEPVVDPSDPDPPIGQTAFRSGLSASDLDLTPEERAEFDRER